MAGPVKNTARKLSHLVSEVGIDPFTRDDFFLVSSTVAHDPARLVLVGGQALEVWGVLLDVLAPTGETSPLTEDTDWLGSADDAQWLAELLGSEDVTVELTRATLDDNTPNTATMYIERRDGRILFMDFLHSVIGLSEADIKKLAVQIDLKFAPVQNPASIRVLHPLHCLACRMANLKELPSKRGGNGQMQAHWAVDIMHAYLASVAQRGDAIQVRKACHVVAKLAEYGPAEYCYIQFNVDPLQAITPEVVEAGGELFATKDWPNTVERIKNKRAKWHRKEAYAQAIRASKWQAG